jgi:hypothetical protein
MISVPPFPFTFFPQILHKENQEPPIHADGCRFIQESKHLDTMRTTHAGRLSGKIVGDSAAVFSGTIGVHRRPSAVAEGLGFLL